MLAACRMLPSLLKRLVLPPGVPGIEAGGVCRPGGSGEYDAAGVWREEDGIGEAGLPKSESTSSLTSFLELVRGYHVRGRAIASEQI